MGNQWGMGRDAAGRVPPGGTDFSTAYESAAFSERAVAERVQPPLTRRQPRRFAAPIQRSGGGGSDWAASSVAPNVPTERSRSALEGERPRHIRADTRTPESAPRRVTAYERFLKPLIDRSLALVILIVLSPLLAVVAVMVAVSLGRPIVLRQKRIGRNGEVFMLHKFRTMHPDRRGEHTESDYVGDDRRITHKHPGDPRLTRVGPAAPEMEPRRAPAALGRAHRETEPGGAAAGVRQYRRQVRAVAARAPRSEAGSDRTLASHRSGRRGRNASSHRYRHRVCTSAWSCVPT